MRVPDESDVRSHLRSPEVAARVGLWLGICFAVAFLTGLYSHALQDPPSWFVPLRRPVWSYRVSQGLHYLAGTACVPLLLVKLYAVYPKLFARPPWLDRAALLRHGLERASIALLVASSLFQVATGLANSTQWYPWAFSFRSTHYAVAWVAIGSLLVHVAVKLPTIRAALRADPAASGPGPRAEGGLSRRALIRTTYLATGLVVVSVAGSAVPWLRRVSVFENHFVPSGGIPINKTARRAGVTVLSTDPGWRLEVVHGQRTASLSREDLRALPRQVARLPIACVEGWSASGEWDGVRVRDLLALVGAPRGSVVTVTSLQPDGPFRTSTLLPAESDDPLTLVALGLDGDDLSIDHGFPCRLIAPGRPGVLQTKWLARIEVES
ncbi:molybdopterin-dependent oxidoreductase [Nocardioides iriomotensis]|uniref:Molybdopterin-binding protein n=1 Tax=Nocardioides iriomotensis TaxID=715784 RepID=A0A4Q5J8T8_9ACTN|nr:molybdopterin-dependent oxidoreductase [Nocardioides iriomotensis]RYU14328.1 molybdopterin-binding protein [Nocardioides iriomotensis]